MVLRARQNRTIACPTYSMLAVSGSSPRPLPMCCGSSTWAPAGFIRSRCSKKTGRRRWETSGSASISEIRKETVIVPESSTFMREHYIRPGGVKGWVPKATIEDGDIAVSKAACSGPDIWVDPQIGDAFFLSDALGTTPKKAKADKGFLPTQMPGALTLVDGGRYGRRSEFRLQLSSRAYSGSSRESAP